MSNQINKEKLLEEKKMLEAELATMGRFDKETGDWDAMPEEQDSPEADENDLADRSEDYGERTAMINTFEIRLKNINTALAEIEKGSGGGYGVCDICGNKIEKDRMEANPAAHTCKGCMEKVV